MKNKKSLVILLCSALLLVASTGVRVFASGGAGKMEHFYDAVQAGADILLAASVFHFKMIGIPELKAYLAGLGVDVIR